MADSLSPEDWLEWKAVAVIDGWYAGWAHTAEIVAAIANAATRQEITTAADPREAARKAKFKSGSEILEQLNKFKPKKPDSSNLTPSHKMAEVLEAREQRRRR